MQGMQPHPLAIFLSKIVRFGGNFRKIKVIFRQVEAKFGKSN